MINTIFYKKQSITVREYLDENKKPIYHAEINKELSAGMYRKRSQAIKEAKKMILDSKYKKYMIKH